MENKWIILQLLFLCYQNVFSTVPQQENSHNSSLSKRENIISCGKGWFPFGDMCYAVGKKGNAGAVTWHEAEERCQGYGGQLATIHSKELNDFLASYLVLRLQDSVWLGLHSPDSEELVWVDGSPLDYTNWQPNEPSRRFNKEQEDCAHMVFASTNRAEQMGKWNDLNCGRKLQYICQKSKEIQRQHVADPRLCSDGGWKFDQSCFHFINESKSWSEAEDQCRQQHQGHLGSLGDYRLKFFLDYVLQGHQNTSMWIGIQIKDERQQWWTSGWPVAFSDWEESEDKLSVGTCAVFAVGSKWVLQSCTNRLPFICETSTESPPVLKAAARGLKCPHIPNTKQSLQWRDLGGERCYHFETHHRCSWTDANFFCTRRGGSLVSIHSEEEVKILSKFVKFSFGIHMGLFRHLMHDEEFVWSDGSPLDFTYWAHNEPNSISEQCGEMRREDMRWNDIACDVNNGYVCSVTKVARNTSDVLTSMKTPVVSVSSNTSERVTSMSTPVLYRKK